MIRLGPTLARPPALARPTPSDGGEDTPPGATLARRGEDTREGAEGAGTCEAGTCEACEGAGRR